MRFRHASLAVLGLGWLLAVACGSDDTKHVAKADEAGAAGEAGAPPSSGGSSMQPGAAGDGGAVSLPQGGASAGEAGEPPLGGASGGGVPAVEGGADGAAGSATTEPPQVSVCGEGKYKPFDSDCATCPTLPNPNYPSMLTCPNLVDAGWDSQNRVLSLSWDANVREAFSGMASVSYVDADNTTGEGSYPWSFLTLTNDFKLLLSTVPATAEMLTVTFSATDACGFIYYIGDLVLYADGPDAFTCIPPA